MSDPEGVGDPAPEAVKGAGSPAKRKSVLLRLDPAVHEALARWASDDLRSVNAQIEMLLRDALRREGRAVSARPQRRPGRPRKDEAQ